MLPVLYIVVPCYNEEEVLPETSKRLLEKINYLIEQNKITKEMIPIICFFDIASTPMIVLLDKG